MYHKLGIMEVAPSPFKCIQVLGACKDEYYFVFVNLLILVDAIALFIAMDGRASVPG